MSEELIISEGNKEEKYALLYSQIAGLVEDEDDMIANMANFIIQFDRNLLTYLYQSTKARKPYNSKGFRAFVSQ